MIVEETYLNLFIITVILLYENGLKLRIFSQFYVSSSIKYTYTIQPLVKYEP